MIILIFLSIPLLSCNTVEPPVVPERKSADEAPAWSPDGKWIAYHHLNNTQEDSLYSSGLYIIDTNGNNRRLVVTGAAYNPDWSPDGEKIAFNSGDIFTVTIDGAILTRITNIGSVFFPNWSPNSRKIAFDRSGTQQEVGIWILNLISGYSKKIGYGSEADWSPSGEKLIYSGSPGSTQSESQIWIIDTNGENNVQITSNNYIINRSPSWSPNGSTIAWTTDQSICLMSPDGSNQKELIGNYSSSPSWSPDSKKIAFQKQNEERNKVVIWTINIDGSGLKQITH